MRIIRFIDTENILRQGCIKNDNNAYEVRENSETGWELTGNTFSIGKLLAPVAPSAIFCIGLNYKSHALETGMPLPEYPVVFMKNPASVAASSEPVILPASCRNPLQVDYEIELAVIIGKAAKNVSEDSALDYVKGYTIGNDISARKWQKTGGGNQWVRGKSFDTFCPLGPHMVTPDEITDPDNLELTLKLNGKIMQRANTSDMIFSVKKLIAYLSEDTTLLPDTIIMTGTPSGVGFTRKPPVFLKADDKLELTIDKIGKLENHVM